MAIHETVLSMLMQLNTMTLKLGFQAEAAVHSFPYLTILFRITVQFMVPRLMKIFRLVILELKVVLKEIE